MSLPELFKSSLDIENYKKMIEIKDISEIESIKNNEKKKLQINKDYINQFKEIKQSHEINEWSYIKTEKVRHWKNDLAFTYLINYNFMYFLKSRESSWSWCLIVISTFCSSLTILDIANITVLEFIKYIVTFFSIITSLIAAYMKKENYVERIKEMDRYIQKVGVIHMELEGILQSKPWNRIPYSQFTEKYYNDIVQLFSYPPPMSPEEYKVTIYNLTVHNPELIYEQSPWYELRKLGDIEYYHMTPFGKQVILSHRASLFKINRCRWFMSGLYKCFFSSSCCNRICSHYRNYHSFNFLNYEDTNKYQVKELLENKKFDNEMKKEIIKENLEFDKFWEENMKKADIKYMFNDEDMV